MAFNIRNRNLLSLVHHTERDLRYLLDLARDLKRAKYSGVEQNEPGGQEHRADLREDLHPHPLRVRGGGLRRGRPRDLHRPDVVADRAQGVDEGHRARARPDVRRHRVPRLRAGDRRGAGGVRRGAGLQRAHRRVPPDADAGRRAHDDRALPTSRCTEIAYAFVGDGRNNVANSLLLVGAKLGMDVRIGAPRDALARATTT